MSLLVWVLVEDLPPLLHYQERLRLVGGVGVVVMAVVQGVVDAAAGRHGLVQAQVWESLGYGGKVEMRGLAARNKISLYARHK